MTNPIRLRTKSVRIACSEQDALAIVTPFVQVTAYMLAVNDAIEMPQVKTFAKTVMAGKLRLSLLLSNALGKAIPPDELGSFSVDVSPMAGFFKISCTQTTELAEKKKLLQGYSIRLQCESGLTTLFKLMQCVDGEKKLTQDDRLDQAYEKLQQMGI